jgi:hypothetical protein
MPPNINIYFFVDTRYAQQSDYKRCFSIQTREAKNLTFVLSGNPVHHITGKTIKLEIFKNVGEAVDYKWKEVDSVS